MTTSKDNNGRDSEKGILSETDVPLTESSQNKKEQDSLKGKEYLPTASNIALAVEVIPTRGKY